MPLLTRELKGLSARPEKILQFGTGNFLKGFINWIVHRLNETTDLNAGIVAIKLRRGNAQQIDAINAQDGLFTLNIRGVENGEDVDRLELIESQVRALTPYDDYDGYMALAEQPELSWVISNTTEAGIYFEPEDRADATPPESFPAKLTQLLYRRYSHFNGDTDAGLRIFCCELIENNAQVLKDIILRHAELWQLDEGFSAWVQKTCLFCDTLVDRIVTGKPSQERREQLQSVLGYADDELIETECYYQWVIETSADDMPALSALFPESTGLNVVLTEDLDLYRQRKVRILNGAHTGSVSIARLAGIETVYQGTCDPLLTGFMRHLVYREICPTIAMDAEALNSYADDIMQRFANPSLHHEWQAIALNSVSKWRARLLPVVKDSLQNRTSDFKALAASLAAMLVLYRGHYQGNAFDVFDDADVIESIQNHWKAGDLPTAVRGILASESLWGEDLTHLDAFYQEVVDLVQALDRDGLAPVIEGITEA